MALLLRDNFETSPEQLIAFLPYLGTTIVVAGVVFLILGTSRNVWRLSVMRDYLRIVAAVILTVSVSMAVGFVTNRLQNVSRALPVIAFVLMICALIGLRVTARLAFSWIHRTGNSGKSVADFARDIDTVLLVGMNRLTNLYVASVDDIGGGAVRIAGVLTKERDYHGRFIGPHEVLGYPSDAGSAIRNLGVHGVFVTRIVVMAHPEELEADDRAMLTQASAMHQIPLQYFPETLGFARPQAPAIEAKLATSSASSLSLESLDLLWRETQRPYWAAKRIVDCAVSAVLLVALSPVLAIVALAVLFDDGFPIIFWQQRPGKHGKPIRIYKFRTMAHPHDGDGRRLSDQQRLSSIGAFLRSTRLDELPQLFNVFVGDMSFIGPRPLLPVDQYPGLEARLAIPPGITGWAQINGGRMVNAADKAAMDVWYLKNASPLVDLRICIHTLRMILAGERPNPQAVAAAWQDLEASLKSALPVGADVADETARVSKSSTSREESGSQALA